MYENVYITSTAVSVLLSELYNRRQRVYSLEGKKK